MPQILDSNKQIISNMIDEHYNPRNLNEKAFLNQRVAKVFPKDNSNLSNDFLSHNATTVASVGVKEKHSSSF